MTLSDSEISLIMDRVKKEVIKKFEYEKQVEVNNQTIVIMPSFVPSPQKALEHIIQKYGDDVTLIFINDAEFVCEGFVSETIKSEAQKKGLLQRVTHADKIVLATPSIGILKRMSKGHDDGYIEGLILRSILWGKEIDVVLDFDPPKFRRGTFFEDIVNAIDGLTSMGVKISVYKAIEDANKGKISLLTEHEIIDAKQEGIKTIICTKDAIITPLAKDCARELKINIEY